MLGIPELRNRMSGAGAQGAAALALEAGEFYEAIALGLAGVFGVFAGEVAVVLRFDFAAFVGFDVLAVGDPFGAEGGESFVGGAGEGGVAPGAAAIVDSDGGVGLYGAADGFRGREGDFAEGDADVGEEFALDVDAGAGGELVAAVGFEGVFGSDHVGKVER